MRLVFKGKLTISQIYGKMLCPKVLLGLGGSIPLGAAVGAVVAVAVVTNVILHLRVRNAERRSGSTLRKGGSNMPEDRYGNALLVNLVPAAWLAALQPWSPLLIASVEA